MRLNWENKILFDGEGDGGSGGGGAASLLGTPPDGGTPPAGGGGGNPPPGAAGGAGGAGAGGAPNDPAKSTPTDWRTSLPKELQEDATLKKFTSVHALAGAYVNAQKLIGADKIAIPTEHTSAEEFRGVLNKLGLPEKVDDYKLEFKEKSIGTDFTKKFTAKAHEIGILPKQAQALADWYGEVADAEMVNAQNFSKQQFEQTVADLKKEWGNGYNLNVGRANKVLLEYGGKELVQAFNEQGLGANKSVLQLLAKLGEHLYKEPKHLGGGESGVGDMTPKELDAAMAKLRSEPAFYDRNHPRHKIVVEEMDGLAKQRWAPKS